MTAIKRTYTYYDAYHMLKLLLDEQDSLSISEKVFVEATESPREH
jgi:hypothetical protein